ncbi:MAG TPA: N-acetyl-alpha-D-glucosaminyl L-malate synthase BshA [Gemmatimonadetes bacterium]|nr:N-acetyl-alpha-D-glucosaminyl L-malate synthase BshA [Gemmatimonadota bacterium]
MKIGITCYPTYGGSGAVATELGLALGARGHEVHFVSYDQPFRLAGLRERVIFHQVEMEDYPLFEHPPYALALAVALHDTALRHGLDLVHMHYAIPHAVSAYLARQMLGDERGLRIVTTLHGTDITLVGLHPSFHEITRFSILGSDGLTAVSEYLKEQTVEGFSVPEERIEVIPNFIDTDVWRPDRQPCQKAMFASEGESIVMHVSNFRSVKRAEDVVSVFSRIQERVPARLVMVGDGPDRPRASQLARELDIEDRVLFLGKHPAVEDLLSCTDLFLLPSEKESFGLAALEAMASGVPVIATRAGGMPEVVEDGVSGRLLDVGDVSGMAEAGVELLKDKDLRERISSAGLDVAKSRYSTEMVVPQYEAYYERILSS